MAVTLASRLRRSSWGGASPFSSCRRQSSWGLLPPASPLHHCGFGPAPRRRRRWLRQSREACLSALLLVSLLLSPSALCARFPLGVASSASAAAPSSPSLQTEAVGLQRPWFREAAFVAHPNFARERRASEGSEEGAVRRQREALCAQGPAPPRPSTKLFGNCCAAARYLREVAEAGEAGEAGGADGEAEEVSGDSPVTPRVGPSTAGKRPSWFHVPAPKPGQSRFNLLKKQIKSLNLHTVCEEAKCPNIAECWEGGTATLMLMGDTCTRGCKFCAIKTSNKPPPLDPREPEKVTEAVSQWSIDYLVLTSVDRYAGRHLAKKKKEGRIVFAFLPAETRGWMLLRLGFMVFDRDDLPDGGANHFARTVRLLKEARPEMFVECLVPDFQGNLDSVRKLACSGLDVFAHNIETVRRLTPFVRDRRASFDQSLFVLREAKRMKPGLFTKSSIMVGLGETREEVRQTLEALREHDVDAVTLGQYLRPSKAQLGIVRFVTPPEFEEFGEIAKGLGFKYVVSAPLSRSSYRAGEYFLKNLLRKERAKLQADVGGLRGSETEIAK